MQETDREPATHIPQKRYFNQARILPPQWMTLRMTLELTYMYYYKVIANDKIKVHL